MSAPFAVISRLEALSAVTALVSTRIYQGTLGQNPVLPAIRVQRVSEDEPMQLRGQGGLLRTRVQVDSVAGGGDPISLAVSVDNAVHGNGAGTALVGWTGEVSGITVAAILPAGVREAYDSEELDQYKVMRDVFVWWKS